MTPLFRPRSPIPWNTLDDIYWTPEGSETFLGKKNKCQCKEQFFLCVLIPEWKQSVLWLPMYWEPLSNVNDWIVVTLWLLQKGSQELLLLPQHPNLPVKMSAKKSDCILKMTSTIHITWENVITTPMKTYQWCWSRWTKQEKLFVLLKCKKLQWNKRQIKFYTKID